MPRYCRPVLEVETGKIYPSIKECAREYWTETSNIRKCLKDETKTCRGYHLKGLELKVWQKTL